MDWILSVKKNLSSIAEIFFMTSDKQLATTLIELYSSE